MGGEPALKPGAMPRIVRSISELAAAARWSLASAGYLPCEGITHRPLSLATSRATRIAFGLVELQDLQIVDGARIGEVGETASCPGRPPRS